VSGITDIMFKFIAAFKLKFLFDFVIFERISKSDTAGFSDKKVDCGFDRELGHVGDRKKLIFYRQALKSKRDYGEVNILIG
jgi:hypothetical protein